MKIKTKNLLLAAFCSIFLVCIAFGFATTNQVSASELGITMEKGASIRVVEDGENATGCDTGIRFKATVSSTLASEVITDGAYVGGAEIGMFIVPQQYIDAYNASGYTDYFTYFSEVKGKQKADIAYVCDAADFSLTNDTTVYVSIARLLEKNYNLSYQGVAYCTKDGTTYSYTEPSDARNVSYVANAALLSTEEDFTDEERTALANVIKKSIELKSNLALTLNAGETLDLAPIFAAEITASDLAFTITNGDCATIKGSWIDTALDDAGEATVNVTAYDGLVDFDITVTVNARTIEANEVIDFKYASDTQYVQGNGESTFEFLETFQGANGVMKATSVNWGHMGFRTLKPITEYSGKYLVIRMWIETTASDAFVYIVDSANHRSLTTIKTGCWVNYYFDGAVFLEQWKEQGNYYSSLATNRAGDFYIDKIYMTDKTPVIDVSSSSDLAKFKNKGDVNSIEYLDTFEGAQGVVKVDAKSWGCLGFPTTDWALDNYAGYKYLVIRMYATVAGNFQIAESNGTQLSAAVANSWIDVYFDGPAFVDQWDDQGNYYSALIMKSTGIYYIDEIFMTNELGKTPVCDVENSSMVSSSYFKNQWDASYSYLAEYQGAKGVLKVDAKNYGCFSFKNLASLDFLSNYEYLVVRAWVDTAYAGSGANFIRLGYSTGETVTLEAGKWVDYKFSMDGFIDFWSTYGWSDYRASLVFGYASTYYIDCIYAI